MKGKIEEYVRAVIEAEQAKGAKNILILSVSIILTSTFVSLLIRVIDHPTTAAIFITLFFSIFGFAFYSKFEKKQKAAEQKRDLLHPTDGEEGAWILTKKKINEILTGALGKKFTGVRNTSDIDE